MRLGLGLGIVLLGLELGLYLGIVSKTRSNPEEKRWGCGGVENKNALFSNRSYFQTNHNIILYIPGSITRFSLIKLD